MKTHIIPIIVFLQLLIHRINSQCQPNFSELTIGSNTVCIKCDTTCATCSGITTGDCLSCPTDFTFDSASSYCLPPSTQFINTVESSYKFYNFKAVQNWNDSLTLQTQHCQKTTILKLKANANETYIKRTHSNLSPHYKIRIRVSLWWLISSDPTDYITIAIKGYSDDNLNLTKDQTVLRSEAVQLNSTSGIYCSGAFANNSQIEFTDHYSDKMEVIFTSNATKWGIREYVFIEYKCDTKWCSVCNDSSWNKCYKCADEHRYVEKANANDPSIQYGQCRCNTSQNYFKYPNLDTTTTADDNYCTKPCPHLPNIGSYYGDPSTQTCVKTCPDDSTTKYLRTFADDVSAQCVAQCPASDPYGNPYFHDLVNKKCVTNCPSTQPYKFSNSTIRICVSTCPESVTAASTKTYKLDSSMSCVQTCYSNTQKIPLFKDDNLGACVDDCVGVDWWADYTTGKCVSDCPNYFNTTDNKTYWYFEDNTTTKNRCTRVCPEPLYWGDKQIVNIGGTNKCIDHCYGGKFGDTAPGSDRQCVQTCEADANTPYFGLLTGNRSCVKTCPDGTWATTDGSTVYVCTVTPSGCLPDSSNADTYADNATHKCVSKGSCSDGQFSYDGPNDDRKCVIKCPSDSNTYADIHTMHCETTCSLTTQFADPTINRCVPICEGTDLYADTQSGNKCVERCNQTGTKPFRDHTTKTCVAICPTTLDLYSDPDAQSCVYNCSQGRYKDKLTDSSDKQCVTHCPSPLWGSNTTGFGVCVERCPQNPPLFGDEVNGYRICVDVCSDGLFGDQSPYTATNTGFGDRECLQQCPDSTQADMDYYAQPDELRRCVSQCNETTFGRSDNTCVKEEDCFGNEVGDNYTQLCTTWCSQARGLFADNIVTDLCVQQCPINNSVIYYADPTTRYCVPTCDATNDYYGNNETRTCVSKCIDFESFADAQHTNRFCIAVCTNTASQLYYRNNRTKVCVVPADCQTDYFADNLTQYCVRKCPINGTDQTWGQISTKTCVEICTPQDIGNGTLANTYGDDTTGVPKCVFVCPSLPMRWAHHTTRLCVAMCPQADGLFGEDYERTCVETCPMDPDDIRFTYSFFDPDNNIRRCLLHCPDGYYADYLQRKCLDDPEDCTKGWGDPYNNSCTQLCNGDPYNTYGDNDTWKCESICTADTWADNYTGDRICIQTCAGTYDAQGVSTGTYDRFADNYTQFCQSECKQPKTWADWQTHRCQLICSSTPIPTYSCTFVCQDSTDTTCPKDYSHRCVIALTCPYSPDKLYGDNNTRSCVPSCRYVSDSDVQWADNITRTCLPQCINWTDSGNINWTNSDASETITTRYYGDTSKGAPICVIKCPKSPRLFGENATNRCVSECPDNTYGDQTGNRSCVTLCPNINSVTWFAQIHQQLCVLVCEDETWGSYHNTPIPKCATVPTDCIKDQYADNSTHLCVPQCPQSQNYFGDPSTRLCVDKCPTLAADVYNNTADIDEAAGHLYADYSTRLCVHKCPQTHGPRGTFGDNQTNTCVHRCPDGTYGDAQDEFRACVKDCTSGTFADNLTNTCVEECPSSPPYFGDQVNWKCVTDCPGNTWADASSRLCVATCPNSEFRLTDERKQCVDVCPSTPDLYGDPDTYHCVTDCTDGSTFPFADPTTRKCVDDCDPLFEYNNRCVFLCPQGYYANSTFNCVIPTECDVGTIGDPDTYTYGDNKTTKCVETCSNGGYADPVSRYCIAVCPSNYYGYNNKCIQDCNVTAGSTFSASNLTQLCESDCPEYTYHEDGVCKQKCETGYANDVTGICDTVCPTNLYTDPRTHDCIATCYDNQTHDGSDYFRDGGACVITCSSNKFRDFITGNCVEKCSDGYWGNTGNYTCIPRCISGQYGYETNTLRTCYQPNDPLVPDTHFGDPQSGQFVLVCPTTPKLYFGDRELQQCKQICAAVGLTDYYGDPSTRECQTKCQNASFYTADPNTGRCELRCTIGTYRYNDSSNSAPICKQICPEGFADNSSSICIDICPAETDTFGFHNTTSNERICVDVCPENFYSEYQDRTCVAGCSDLSDTTGDEYFAYNTTHECVLHCIDSFADLSNHKCMDKCHSNDYPFADNSTNKCVYQCPSDPDYYGDDHVCVLYCTTSDTYANPFTDPELAAEYTIRQCVARCPNMTDFNTYGDPLTGRCVKTCSLGYYADNFTNQCKEECPFSSFGYNQTRQCVGKCPANQNLYGDPFTHMCAYTCSNGWFGSQKTQQCVQICEDTTDDTPPLEYWGDPLTTLCVQVCPDKIYSYGENTTRKCVKSCQDYTGYADNSTRLCRSYCQNETGVLETETYMDDTTWSCVFRCPDGFYMQTIENKCVPKCQQAHYFADNYSRYCVYNCPDNPQSYADNNSKICLYSCTDPDYPFSDNRTNQCVQKCPDPADPVNDPQYYGDTHVGRCVQYCTEGTWGQSVDNLCKAECPPNTYADNLTRKCVDICPLSEGTFADEETHTCARVCSPQFWALNASVNAGKPECVDECPKLTGDIETYSDDISRFCVLECPDPYFGRNDTHQCVDQCPESESLFGHPKGRVCVTFCYEVNSIPYYADDTTRTCVQKCPLNRWANPIDFICQQQCGSLYKNMHTQFCVVNCPEDPDEYGDKTPDGTCVRKCPNGKYAVVDNDAADGQKRICVSDCSVYGKIKDNITNRCVGLQECPTEPYMYGQNIADHKCVLTCSEIPDATYYADNKSQTCVLTCPSEWEYFGDQEAHTCVSLCPNYLFADPNDPNRRCININTQNCANGWFADNQTSACVERCSQIKPFYYEDTDSFTCVEQCPPNSYAYDLNQTCIKDDDVSGKSQCPSPFFADPVSKKCVQKCPYGYFAKTSTRKCVQKCFEDEDANVNEYADSVLRACVQTCSNHTFSFQDATGNLCVQFCQDPYFAQNQTHSCVQTCDNLLALPSTRSCQNYCPQPYFADQDNKKCVLGCEPKYADIFSRTCVDSCTSPSFSQTENYTCVLLCPDNTFGNGSRICASSCQQGLFANPQNRTCDSECPQYPILFADDRTNECLPGCSFPLYAFTQNRTCLSSCPNITDLIYLADDFNRKCVLECTNQQISFADYENNFCTKKCPEGTFASNLTKQCVPQCPTIPVDTFGENNSNICFKQCQNYDYGDPDSLICVPIIQCEPRFADPTTKICVQFCPSGYFAQQSDWSCKQTCNPNTFADPSTHKCVTECPAIQDLFKYRENWTCLETCPEGYFANQELRECVLICESNDISMFALQVTKQCVTQCPSPYRGFIENNTCLLTCPPLYFYNTTRNLCTKCPEQCTACTGPYSCTKCISGYNLFNGICSYSCLPSNGLTTYAHPITNQCIQDCPLGYYGDNSTYLCSSTCPVKQYGNKTTRLCQHCPKTCSLCLNLTYCNGCQEGSVLAIDHMCYTACNLTHVYSYNGVCYLQCPLGTYVSYTNVHCEPCSDLCGGCIGTPTNCTSCTIKYYYNRSCLQVCPDGYFGDTDLVCKLCSESQVDVCTKKLAFTTKLSVQNYKYVITMDFNDQVDIKKQLDQILKVKLKVNRRVMQVNTYVNDGITYTYEILSNGSIKLYLEIEADLQNPVFDVQIVQPTAIVSTTTGTSLQDTTAQLIAEEKIQFYPPQQAQDAPIRKAAQFCITFILVLLGLITLISDTMIKPIQLIQLIFFHCLTVAPIPASLFYYILDLKLSLLQFLPNWLSIPLPKDVTLHPTSTQKTIDIFVDYNFLRNVGQILLMFIIFFGLWLIFFILSNKRVVTNKDWHGLFETVSVRRFRWSIVHEIFSLFYVPILWFGFMQFQQLFGTEYLGFNGFVTLICVVSAVLLPGLWFAVWWKKQTEQIQERFPFLTNRIAKGNHKAILQVPVSLVHLLFCSIWLVGLIYEPVPQMILLILTNLAYTIYLIVVRPFLIHINTIFTCIMLLLIIALEVFITYFQLTKQTLSSSQKTEIVFPLLVAMSVVLVLCIIWSFWRCIWQLTDVWKFFKTTNFYKVFGDPDVEIEKQVSENYENYEKIAMNVQADIGDVVVENVVKECNEKGENVIKVKKKVLKKKKKARRVKKGEGLEENDQEFVRINNVNPFDYDYDENYKKEQKRDPMKRTFDDDLRDIVSDEQEYKERGSNEKIKKPMNNFMGEEKQIAIQKHEKEIKDIDDLGDVENSEKDAENQSPFEFLDGFSELQSEKVSDNHLINEEHSVNSNEDHEAPENPHIQPVKSQEQRAQEGEEPPKEEQHEDEYEEGGFDELLDEQIKDDSNKDDSNKDDSPVQQLRKSQSSQEMAQDLNEKQKEEDEEEDEEEDKRVQQKEQKIQESEVKRVKGIEQLLAQEEENSKKKKNLLFLFEEQDED